ncbi:Na+/H+ antiporter NhaC family protein [Bittarella massiliensis (ex Durand et al. 2017)]|uniref:Na+/H+ antiporter NhaC family protein n=1 Tax=Bittarella massiliensis (ex Durand et al. 2017) TaxID=1720313 RepID=UPI001AA13F11|nr:Na+/H+ antiporter NhaC family protein [Bittarella massiliensis (ex Durand et al. 2017)]MBO1679716.1 Na+/H+ antiporter NhaC family protein [Bittarella massiliensis (ex Durand et al. 2017)]
MEHFGFWSLLPPILAIVLALITKEVISSLLVGILSGLLIYTGGNPLQALVELFSLITTKIGDNAYMVVFLSLLGALVCVVTMSGGSRSYGDWASRKIKKRSSAMLATSGLGLLIFIDDYFNCLTVGTVMRPITDKHLISRAKLAYVIDATAAPICAIAPISSFAAYAISVLADTGATQNGMTTFLQSVPFNLYAILTIIMVIALSLCQLDFGPMERFEKACREGRGKGSGAKNALAAQAQDELDGIVPSEKGRIWDLVLPIASLILFTVASMLWTGGFGTVVEGEKVGLMAAFANTDSNASLTYGAFGALIVALLLYLPRRLMTFKEFFGGITTGFKSMLGAITIMVLAWSIGGVCTEYLLTGQYVGELVRTSQFPLQLFPAVIFAVAGGLAFATGTSWGTFAMLIPISVEISRYSAPELIPIIFAAILAGAVYGDHCSPISDTTILSSAGAGCNHIDHVSTQLPYATLAAGCCFVGFIVAGFTANALLTLAVAVALLLLSLLFLHRRTVKKEQAAAANR